ncbi:MAG: MBL fold metallo-hydrolase [Chloroflexi bacterium]|nr:MAG: MBL fold metallo-hydrolase [Chloroflexota bacterium]
MALNNAVSFTWVGHGTWKARSAKGKEILIDPWVMNNPAAPENLKTVDKCDVILITHGHFDHIHDAVEIARHTKPTIVCNHEIGVWLGSKGLDGDKIVAANIGGQVEVEGIKVTLVHAEHTCGITENGHLIYGGEACGFELGKFDVAFLPIGGFYTMGVERAAKAVSLLGVKTVVPMHFATFPILSGRPDQLQELVGPGVKVLDVKPGDTV